MRINIGNAQRRVFLIKAKRLIRAAVVAAALLGLLYLWFDWVGVVQSLRLGVSFIMAVAVFAYFTNPFVRFSIIRDPSRVIVQNKKMIQFERVGKVELAGSPLWRRVAVLKSGWHILSNALYGAGKASKGGVDEIIAEIHKQRFDPKQPFLISGDHFSMLYPRSLGIFYHSILDPRTALDDEDWINRQAMVVKTLHYALDVFAQSDELATTIVPIAPSSVVLMHVYAPPSDTLYSLLYGLVTLKSTVMVERLYPFAGQKKRKLSGSVVELGEKLLEEYKESLVRHMEDYLAMVRDQVSGLVKREVHLSGTKDLVFRESAFYDNVVMWATMKLAHELGVYEVGRKELERLKFTILEKFWDQEKGYFVEDLSGERAYSSDWLIVQMTGMLDMEKLSERKFFERSFEHIRKNALDQPFGLQYSADMRKHKQHWPPRIGAPSYASTAIWSNWGMEYIKMLVRLFQVTGKETYMTEAERQLNVYAYNIKRYRGYPEVYDEKGDFFRNLFYQSVRQTGWVVSFEQARGMFEVVRGK